MMTRYLLKSVELEKYNQPQFTIYITYIEKIFFVPY